MPTKRSTHAQTLQNQDLLVGIQANESACGFIYGREGQKNYKLVVSLNYILHTTMIYVLKVFLD